LGFATRITCCVSVVLAVATACSNFSRSSPKPGDKTVIAGARTETGRTTLDLQVGQQRRSLTLDRDATVAPAAPPKVTLVADLPARAVIITDTYPSLAGGLSYCQAGEEQFLRVISTASEKPVQTFVTKLASCRENLELADPGLEWNEPSSSLQIHWLTGPSGNADERTIVIANDGSATVRPK
jgi:hypothetical protein